MPDDPFPQFCCMRCGACCRWEGPVRVGDSEIDAIAAFSGMTPEEFLRTRTVLAPDRRSLSLIEKADGSCFYYDDVKKCCLIQPVKPRQCSDFPRKWNFPGWDSICAGGAAMKKK